MSNPWYDKINRQLPMMQAAPQSLRMPQGVPANLMGQIAQAMRSPQAYSMQAFSDVPREMWNNPEQALQYIMQTRGITQADIQNMIASLPIPR